MFNDRQRGQCSDADTAVSRRLDPTQLGDAAKVDHIRRREQLLLHGRKKVRTTGDDLHLIGMLRQHFDSLGESGRTQQLKAGQTQSAPPIVAPCRAESARCLCGPLPRNHSEPPCSRKVSGCVGSTPAVISTFFAPCWVRNADKTRSGVNGASRKRTPTAS